VNLRTLSGTSPSYMTFCAAWTTVDNLRSIALEARRPRARPTASCVEALSLATIAAESGAGCRSSPSDCWREPATRLPSVSESCLVTASTTPDGSMKEPFRNLSVRARGGCARCHPRRCARDANLSSARSGKGVGWGFSYMCGSVLKDRLHVSLCSTCIVFYKALFLP
jgi:hypothetical protein